jgi:MYXO-CTERM domain-containing protein
LIGNKLKVLSGNVTVDEGITATISSDLSAETVNHSLRKLGGGTLIVNGHAGQMVVKAGTLGGTGALDHLTVRAGGTIKPGGVTSNSAAGIMTVTGSFTLQPGSQLSVDIGGTDNSDPQAPDFDQLVVGGAAKLGGTLSVNLLGSAGDPFEPQLGDSFTLIVADSITGRFANLELPALDTGLVWRPIYNPTTFSLLIASQFPGDFTKGGVVGTADYVVWRNTYGATGTMLAADSSGPDGTPDGVVDHFDFQIWAANFGKRANAQVASASVPEPAVATLALAVLAGSLLIRQRRS